MSFNTRTCCGRSSSCLHPRPASSRRGRPLGPLCSPSARPRKGKPSRVGGDPCLSPRGCLGRHCTGPPSSARHPFLRGDRQTPTPASASRPVGASPISQRAEGGSPPFSPALVTVRPGSPAPQRSARHGLSVPSRTGVKGPGDPGTRPSPRPHRSFSPSTRPTPPPPSYPGSNRRRGLFRLRWGVKRRDRAAA